MTAPHQKEMRMRRILPPLRRIAEGSRSVDELERQVGPRRDNTSYAKKVTRVFDERTGQRMDGNTKARLGLASLSPEHNVLFMYNSLLARSPRWCVVFYSGIFMALTMHAAETPTAQADNPLITPSTLQYQYPRFDKIKDADYEPAFDRGMSDQLKEVKLIAQNPEKPTFANTIIALERSGQVLTRVNNIFSNLAGAHTNPALQEIERAIAPKLAAHNDAILLDGKLFARVENLYEHRDGLDLDPESKQVLERYHRDFVRAGANLSETDKIKLKGLNAEIAMLETDFTQNVQKEKNAASIVVENRAELSGLSDTEIAAAMAAAKEDGKEGKFVIRLLNTTGQPVLTSLTNRPLRERIMQASLARGSSGGPYDNRALVSRLARLRAEHAALLGHPNHAAYQLEEQTARNVETVNKLLADLAAPAVANARLEAADLQKIIDQENGGFQLASFDWSFYSEKLRQARYAFDESQVKPYFELNHVYFDGVFFAATRLYGITFKERHDLPVYQPDVRVFEVFDHDGSSLAIYILDPFARPSKRGGAWMSEYVSQSTLLGAKPVVANHLNIPKPSGNDPALLTFDEVTTAFHEFGHALHGMFSSVHYPRFSGTNVPRDFVEYPSQVNEMWAVWPEVLKNYALHYKTGEPLPKELLDKVTAARKFNQGFTTTEYLAAALLDQSWHQLAAKEVPPPDRVLEFEAASLKKVGLDFPPVPPRYRTTYFSHVFAGGYSAGYYSYIWSEVLDADSVEWFKQNGGLKRENGDRFRETLLSRGGSDEALKLFHDFTGRDPYVEPLLERRGLNRVPTAKTN